MSTWNVGITLDISSDHPSANDADLGLSSGIFYWVTGKPGYAGSGYSGDAPAGETWKEHIIDYDRIKDLVRTWGEEDGYSTLSGFKFGVDNTSLFWDDLESNSYNIIGRTLNVYLFLDDVSYQIGSFKVKKTPFERTIYWIECEDINEHKMIPPIQANDETYPLINEDAEGENIPVTLGYVNKAKLLPIYDDMQRYPLAVHSGKYHYVASLTDWFPSTKKVVLNTPGMSFAAGQFAGYYLRRIVGGDSDVFLIETNDASASGTLGMYTYFTLANWFETDPTNDNEYSTVVLDSAEVWYFELYRYRKTLVVSDSEIQSIESSSENVGKDISYRDTDLNEYIHVGNLITDESTTDIKNQGHPGITLKSVDSEKIADINDYTVLKADEVIPDSLVYEEQSGTQLGSQSGGTISFGSDNDNLHDGDKSTNVTLLSLSVLWSGNYYTYAHLYIDVKIPEQLKITEYEQVYLVFDYSLQSDFNLLLANMDLQYKGIDHSGRVTENLLGGYGEIYDDGSGDPTAITTEQEEDLIPSTYYGQEGADSNFNARKSAIDLSALIDDSNWFKAYEYIRIDIWFQMLSNANNFTLTHKFKEFAFVGFNKLEYANQTTYAKVKGEKYGSDGTERIDYAIRHIMEDYDGIASGNIDTSAFTATDWIIGRQLNDKKNSRDYLKELCKQTFTSIVPTREGDKKVISWRNQSTPLATHSTNIKDVLSLKSTPSNKIYNNFQLEYDFDPETGKPNKQLSISNFEDNTESFPGILTSTGSDTDRSSNFTEVKTFDIYYAYLIYSTAQTWAEVGMKVSWEGTGGELLAFGVIIAISSDQKNIIAYHTNKYGLMDNTTYSGGTVTQNGSGVAKWTRYVSGINDYAQAKIMWEACQDSYNQTKQYNIMPSSLSKCMWHPQNINFGIYDDDAAIKFFNLCVEWYTRNRKRIEYTIPVTSAQLDLNPSEMITVNHPYYTNGSDIDGYITTHKIRFKQRDMQIGLVLIPTDVSERNLIIETGSNTTQIQETGSNSTQVQETGEQ